MHEIDKVVAAARRVIESGRRGILVTIVGTQGSTYRRAGARAVISESGESFGTISGGCLERDLAERAQQWLTGFEPRLVTYDSTRDDDVIFGMGLGCRGVVDLLVEPFDAAHVPPFVRDFRWNGREPVIWTTTHEGRELLVEVIRPERAIAIFGGGSDVAPVARIGRELGWRVVVIAPRDVHPDEVARTIELAAFDAAVVMTHNYLYDLTLLGALAESPIAYVGLLGPKKRGDDLLAQLGDPAASLRPRLRNPIGLDLGGETPEEIALSIVSEIQAVLNRKTARALREMNGPIHEVAEDSLLSGAAASAAVCRPGAGSSTE